MVLSHDIPDAINSSICIGCHYRILKISTTEPSLALRNALEHKSVLVDRSGDLLRYDILHTDGDPEHQTFFSS